METLGDFSFKWKEGRDGVVGWGVQGREALYGMCGGQDFIMNRFGVMV